MPEIQKDILSKNEQARRTLIEWTSENNEVSPDKVNRWYTGSTSRRLPNKELLQKLGMDAIGDGWLPSYPLIFPETRVLAIGSCFARYFILWLAEHGFNKMTPQSPYNALLYFGTDFQSVAAIAQQFRWAFDDLNNETLLWIDKHKEIFEATDERRLLVRESLLSTDVLLITLGLSEIWYDSVTGEPLWRALTTDLYDSKRHVFRIESLAQTLHWLETIEQLRKKHLPHLKIVFTVSPIRLSTTFRPISTITANNVSKSILRAALDEFLRNHSNELNQHLFYFPSYEFVTDYFIDPYDYDNRHIPSQVAGNIIQYFVKHYCSKEILTRSGQSLKGLEGGEHLENFIMESRIVSTDAQSNVLLNRMAELEKKVNTLQKICDERNEVIIGLDTAAKERLTLIHQQDAEIKRLNEKLNLI